MQRASSSPTLLGIDRPLLRIGTQSNRIRLVGDQFPQRISKTDIDFGPGVAVRRIVSNSATELIAEVDVRSDAPRGKRRVALGHSMSPVTFAIYDRIDYIKVTPDSATAAFGDHTRGPGYQQFEAIAYLYGADGKRYTADDVELGPVDVNWSLKVFYESEGGNTDFVGAVSSAGLFVPSTKSPANNFDVWVIAEAKIERGREAKPLVGKSYLVVTVPFYVFNGRRYVRDLNRWVDDGPASQSTR
jgi:quinohemoprotein amine dehydrogenase